MSSRRPLGEARIAVRRDQESASTGYSNAEYLLDLYRVTCSTVADTGAAGGRTACICAGACSEEGRHVSI